MRGVTPRKSNWTGASEEKPYAWHAAREEEVRSKYLQPAAEAEVKVIDDIEVARLPNGTIDLGHNPKFGSLHLYARNYDVGSAWKVPDSMAIIGHGVVVEGVSYLEVFDRHGSERRLTGVEVAEIVKQVEPELPNRIFAVTCQGAVGRTGYAAGLAHGLKRLVRATEGAVWMNTEGAELEERWTSIPTASKTELHDGLAALLAGGVEQRAGVDMEARQASQWRDIHPNGRFSTRLGSDMFSLASGGRITL